MKRSEITAEVDAAPSGSRSAAFFDLDRTLLAGFSGVAFTAALVASGRIGPRDLARSGVAAARLGLGRAGFSALISAFAKSLRGMPEEEFLALGERVFRSWLARSVFPEGRALVAAHQRRRHQVAFVSSALPYQINPLARDLGVEHVLCTRLEVKRGVLTGKVVMPHCWGKGKADAIRTFAKTHRVDLRKSWYYGDSSSDLPAFEVVGNPRPTNPAIRLARIAAKRGWPSRTFRSRGIPAARDVVRTAFAVGSLGPSAALALPEVTRGLQAFRNAAISTWGDVGTRIAGIELDVVGGHHLHEPRPAVYVFNHQSAIDLLLVCKLLRGNFVGISKDEIRQIPLVGRIFSLGGAVFVKRGSGSKAAEALQPVVDAIRRDGLSVAIAPEGTRSPTPRLGPFKKGAFHIAMAAKAPIVPIVFKNALDPLPKHGLVIRPGTVQVEVLAPIPTTRWKQRDLERHVEAVRKRFLTALGE